MGGRLLGGVFIGSQAIAEGLMTRHQLRRRSYRRLVNGVYADPSLPLDHQLRCRAVALLMPPGTAIGGLSAAAWHGAPVAGPAAPVTVLRRPEVLWKGPREVRVHQSELAAGDVETMDDGVTITSAARTAWDVAALEPLGTAVAALDAMVRSGSVDQVTLQTQVESGTGRWGVVRVRRAAALVDARAESPPESRVRVALVLGGLAPAPQWAVTADGRFLGRVDFAWPEQKVALEYEGVYHFDGAQIVRDDARYAALEAAGWRVIRTSAADLADLDGVVERVREALAAR